MVLKYLIGGQAVVIEKTLDCGYLVKHVYEDEDEDFVDDLVVYVENVFSNPPVEKLQEEVKSLENKRNTLLEEVGELNYDISKLQQDKNDWSKMAFNKKELFEAKRITCFTQGAIEPHDLKEGDARRLKISFEINLRDGKIRAWNYHAYYDNSYSCCDYYDEKYGFLCDKTDEEILQITHERQKNAAPDTFNNYRIINTPDKYLIPEFIEKKKRLIKNDQEDKIKSLRSEIEKKTKELEGLIK